MLLYFEVQAQYLNDIGLLQGSEKGFELDRAPSRIEAGVMQIFLVPSCCPPCLMIF